MKKPRVHLDQYVRELWAKREQEPRTTDLENDLSLKHGGGLTSPPAEYGTEELQIFREQMMAQNVRILAQSVPARRKWMMLRTFFRHKRNSQVEVLLQPGGIATRWQGRVRMIGRDFVVLAQLKQRIWLPYHAIESARVPFGTPDVPSSHQHLVYNEMLRQQLLTRFGETVAGREALVQQFFDESLATNLITWAGTRVEVQTADACMVGTLGGTQDGQLLLSRWRKTERVPLAAVCWVRTVSWWSALRLALFHGTKQR